LRCGLAKTQHQETAVSTGTQCVGVHSPRWAHRHQLSCSYARVKQTEKKSTKLARRNGKNGTVGGSSGNDGGEVGLATKIGAPAGLLLGLALILGGGYAYKDQLRGFIDYFIKVADSWGPLG